MYQWKTRIFSHTRSEFPKIKRIQARRLRADRTSIRDVIVMLKWRHNVTFQRIHDFLVVFFMIFPI